MTCAGRLALILAMVGGVAFAQGSGVGTVPPKDAVSVEVLWPNGAPGAVGKDFDDVPKLYCYPATKSAVARRTTAMAALVWRMKFGDRMYISLRGIVHHPPIVLLCAKTD